MGEAPSFKMGRMLERLEPPEGLKFITTFFFPVHWIFAIIGEARQMSVLFRDLDLLDLTIQNFCCLPLRWFIQGERVGVSD